MNKPNFIEPDWPLAGRVGALVTTRAGGVSQDPWTELNLGSNTADNTSAVAQNRKILQTVVGRHLKLQWLRQVHGTGVIVAGEHGDQSPEADACYTDQANQACAVLTADCLPVLFGNDDATEVAVAHAGWRGLSAGILGQALEKFRCRPNSIHAWLGPAISANHYEVGEDLKKAFEQSPSFSRLAVEKAFQPRQQNKWSADLYELARLQLESLGVESVSGGDRCTFAEPDSFYSYRRDGETGRFASLIWLKQ